MTIMGAHTNHNKQHSLGYHAFKKLYEAGQIQSVYSNEAEVPIASILQMRDWCRRIYRNKTQEEIKTIFQAIAEKKGQSLSDDEQEQKYWEQRRALQLNNVDYIYEALAKTPNKKKPYHAGVHVIDDDGEIRPHPLIWQPNIYEKK